MFDTTSEKAVRELAARAASGDIFPDRAGLQRRIYDALREAILAERRACYEILFKDANTYTLDEADHVAHQRHDHARQSHAASTALREAARGIENKPSPRGKGDTP